MVDALNKYSLKGVLDLETLEPEWTSCPKEGLLLLLVLLLLLILNPNLYSQIKKFSLADLPRI